MNEMIHLSEQDGLGRDVFYLSVPNFASIPSRFDLPSEKFLLFIACDSDELSTSEISDWVEQIVDNGVVYVCTWGKDCERVHDIIDEVCVEREIESDTKLPFVMTTWHSKDSLDDALWFALYCTEPYEDSTDCTISTLVLNVKDDERDTHLRRVLSDLEKFGEVAEEREVNEDIDANN
jgi:hypothetical protein